MKKKYYVDREEFICYINGICLLSSSGIVIADDKLCKKAVDALDSGQTIYLTDGDNVVSKVSCKNKKYIETKI